jgi:hypothetical protein
MGFVRTTGGGFGIVDSPAALYNLAEERFARSEL